MDTNHHTDLIYVKGLLALLVAGKSAREVAAMVDADGVGKVRVLALLGEALRIANPLDPGILRAARLLEMHLSQPSRH